MDVHMPMGDFALRSGTGPVVLISGGAGITAVLGMLEHLADERETRNVTFLHAARHRGHHAFGDEVRALARRRPGIRAVVAYDEVGPSDEQGVHYDAVGRIDADFIRANVHQNRADLYYCGPSGFMAGVETALDTLDVPVETRFSEAFAPDRSFGVATARLVNAGA